MWFRECKLKLKDEIKSVTGQTVMSYWFLSVVKVTAYELFAN